MTIQAIVKLAMMSAMGLLFISGQYLEQPDSGLKDSNTSKQPIDVAQNFLEKENVIKTYFQDIENANDKNASRLFSNFIIDDPLYGQIVNTPGKGQVGLLDFFQKLKSDQPDLKVTEKNIFLNPRDPNMLVVQSVRSFSIKGGEKYEDEITGIFTFVPGTNKIQSIKVFYDTLKTREAIKRNQGQ